MLKGALLVRAFAEDGPGEEAVSGKLGLGGKKSREDFTVSLFLVSQLLWALEFLVAMTEV
ncbi:hypothetical protein I79_017419 [Cricetulus griseus]|uniref:Uncharacterized protein n=1 Tax=Cricetulus griseus TaxID=10029 RepID=G3I1Z8_CRIGR|nr:hypothetical protein I79_017419 [Cricetulus griseus]